MSLTPTTKREVAIPAGTRTFVHKDGTPYPPRRR